MSREEALDFMSAKSTSLGLEFARATLCGSIAQVSYVALKQFSTNAEVSSGHRFGVASGVSAAKFCVGRLVQGIPLGLLIYAARVQYNHWEEGTPKNKVPQAVFHALASHYSDDLMFDMAYDLDWPSPRPVAHYILRNELNWFEYDDYVKDLTQAIQGSTA